VNTRKKQRMRLYICERFDLKEDAVIGMLGIGYHRWLEIGVTVEFLLTWMLPELTEAWGNNT